MEQYFPFQSSPLPYSYVALMPHCAANTLYYHHDEYFTNAVYELNNLVVHHRLTRMSLSQLATEDINLPAALLARLRSAAGAGRSSGAGSCSFIRSKIPMTFPPFCQ